MKSNKHQLILFFIVLSLFCISYAKDKKNDLFIAVLDTGIDYQNSPYKNRLIIDWDGQKTSFLNLNDNNDPGHGTHVAHTILDRTKADNIKIVPYKIFDYRGGQNRTNVKIDESIKSESLYKKVIANVVKNNVKIVNISGGYNTYQEDDYQAFKEAKDVLFIVASGNYVLYSGDEKSVPEDLDKYFIASRASKDHPFYNKYQYNFYPCAYRLENIVCVGDAISNPKTDEFKVLSNYGSFFIDVFANGEDVWAMGVGGEKVSMSGSSMAVPKVTAFFANEWNKNQSLSVEELKAKVFKKFKVEPFFKTSSKFGYYLPE